MGDLYSLKVGFSVVVYCLSVSAVPIYNKLVFSGGAGAHAGSGLQKFPYPIATAFLQLGLVALVLALASIAGHFAPWGAAEDSWLLGPHLGYKLRHVWPVGVLFGLKYGITNWGLQLMPTGTHLLLQSTDLIWTVATARALNKERLGCLELLAALLATVGSVMIGLHAGQTMDTPAIPLLVNCLTPLVLALCISTLRSGAKELFRPDNRLQGSVTPTEFTALKLSLSAGMALALSLLLESGEVHLAGHARAAWWEAIGQQSAAGVLFLLLGGVFVLIFQVNITWLSGLTSAVTVGVVGGIKVVPQWLLNAAFLRMRIDMSFLNVGGAALVLSASVLYALSISRPEMLALGRRGLEWRPREAPAAQAERLLPEPEEPEAARPRLASAEQLCAESLVTHAAHLEISVFLENKEGSGEHSTRSARSKGPDVRPLP